MSSGRTLENHGSYAQRIGTALFPRRGFLWGALGILVFLSAHPTPQLFKTGILLIVAGTALRAWCAGYIKAHRGKMHNVRELLTCGPYAHLRNPLYLANGIIGSGVVFLSGKLFWFLFFIPFLFLLYGFIVSAEEAFLSERFGSEYQKYAEAVPRLIPRLTPYPNRKHSPFSWQAFLTSDIHTLVTFLLVILLFYLRGTSLFSFLNRFHLF
jgi:protein-S-isoprenylcysteine O-methyltransferase Ste14